MEEFLLKKKTICTRSIIFLISS